MSEFESQPSPLTAPTVQPRNMMGWILLVLLLSMIFVVQLNSYLSRDQKPDAEYNHTETVFKGVVKTKEAQRMFGVPERGRPKELDGLISEVAPKIHESREAAMLYAVMRYEQADRVSRDDVKILANSGTREERAIGEIYSNEGLKPVDVDRIAKTLDTKKFLDRMALAHARQKAGMPRAREAVITRGEVLGIMVAGSVVVSALVLGLLALFFLYTYLVSHSLPGPPSGSLTLAQADNLALRSATALVAYLGLSLLIPGVKGMPVPIQLVFPAVILIGAVMIIFRRPVLHSQPPETGLQEIGLRRGNTLQLIGWGFVGAVANAPIILLAAGIGQAISKGLPPAEHPIEQILKSPSPWTVAAVMFVASVQAPFFEEILFRGTLLPALARVLKSPIAAGVISSCLFAMIHPTGIPAWPALAAIGGMSAFLTYRTSSLVPSMVMHGVHNFVTLVLALAIG